MKKNYKVYKMNFVAPLHLSMGKNSYDVSSKRLHSDTIKSAVLSCAFSLGSEEEDIRKILNECIFSSAFPYYGDEYFFPKPFVKLMAIKNLQEEKQGKVFKKIHYLGRNYFEMLLHGAAGEIDPAHLMDGGSCLSDHEELLQEKNLTILKSSVNQRVTIAPDYSEDATPFYSERLFFPEKGGLWFMVEFAEKGIEKKLEGLLRLLGDNGIGTDRSVGNGFFKIEQDEITITTPSSASHQMNLSLFCPNKSELTKETLEDSSWQLTKRGGYIAGGSNEDNLSLRKRSIYMFEEGSVFKNVNLEGKVVDLRPKIQEVNHPIWRDGKSIFLPIQLAE